MGNELENMSLGELVETMIFTAVDYNNKLRTEEAEERRISHSRSDDSLKKFYYKEYKKIFEPLKAELDRREKLYSQKD